MARLTGSAGVSEQGKGTGWVARKPERFPLVPIWKAGAEHRPQQRSRPDCPDLASIGSAHANTKHQGMWNPEAKT